MCKNFIRKLKGKDKIWQLNDENKQFAENNAQMVGVLIELNNNNEIDLELREIKMQLESLQSSPNDAVKKIDKKIRNALDDFKIVLIKTKDKNDIQKTQNCLNDLKVLIAQRKCVL